MSITRRIITELRAGADATRAAGEKRYLKSELDHLGVGVPALRRVVKAALRDTPVTAEELRAAVEDLWSHRVHELRMAAVELLVLRVDLLAAADLVQVERLMREARTWALLDNLAVHVAGALVARFPRAARTLDDWSRDEDFWVRRASMLALLKPLREGGGDFERFAGYADQMLDEKEFFIRKAIGWVLRDTGRKRPALVAQWLTPRAARAPGLVIREAVKSLDARQRAAIEKARKGAPPAR